MPFDLHGVRVLMLEMQSLSPRYRTQTGIYTVISLAFKWSNVIVKLNRSKNNMTVFRYHGYLVFVMRNQMNGRRNTDKEMMWSTLNTMMDFDIRKEKKLSKVI